MMRRLILVAVLGWATVAQGSANLVLIALSGGGPNLSTDSYGCLRVATTASISAVFQSDGSLFIDRSSNGGCVTGDTTVTDEWFENSPITGVGSGYYLDRTVTSGSLDADPGACVQLSSDRTYTVTRSSVGTDTTEIDFEIHTAAGCSGTAVATATITLSATYDTI